MIRALLIKHPWVDKILDGTKTWEIRASRTTVRGRIGLVAIKSGTVVGVCDLVDCIGPLSAREYRANAGKAGMPAKDATLGYYKHTYAWVMTNPRYFKKPVPYIHPSGAVIWVKLEGAVEQAIRRSK